MTGTEAAYLAGIIDGEGCISVRKQGRSYGLQLIVVQKDPAILKWLEQTLGGHTDPVVRMGFGKRRIYHRWTLGGKTRIIPALQAMIPYLTLKRSRAELALQLAETILDGGKGWIPPEKRSGRDRDGRPTALTQEVIALRDSIVDRLNHLNVP